MLKKEVREMVKYLISERKSFKVVFANGQVEVVENRGYCLVLNGKAYSDEELVEKMVRFQNNEKKFILSFEEIEEEVEEVAVEEVEEVALEESLVEEVENLTEDLFDESDIAYAEEAIKRESATEECSKLTKSFEIKINVDIKVYEYGITYKEIYEFIEDLPLSTINIGEYNTVMISNTLMDLFPYFDIYNNLIINVSLV